MASTTYDSNPIKARLSPIMEISKRALALQAQGINTINLSLGESDFDTPDYIKEAAIRAIKDGKTKYTAIDGTISLKEAIQSKLNIENKLNYHLDQILVSCGAKHSLYNFARCALKPGDEVILLAPFWTSYLDFIYLTQAKPIIIECPLEQQFKVLPEQLEAAITEKTKAIFINNPCNPTGMMYTEAELNQIAKVLSHHPKVLIVSDEIYEYFVWNNQKIVSIASLSQDLQDRTIVINGVSKSYAMTGWRIGYAAGPENIITEMKNLQSQCTSNPSSISQAAAEAALKGDQSFTRQMVNTYIKRHSTIYNLLAKQEGISCIPSDGTFYIFPKVHSSCVASLEKMGYKNISEYLLEKVHVAVVPGDVFGISNHYFRICFAKPEDILLDVMGRIKKAIGFL